MAHSTQVLFITSNESIIEQLQLNQNAFVKIIDLNQRQTKPTKVPRKSSEFVCVVCGNRAIGYNYNVLSCASCKAFFRRHAFDDLSKLRCLKDNGQCSVEHDIHRKCPRCRLERCLSMGMRKDFILSNEEKQRRKQHLEENRNKTLKRQSTSSSTIQLSSLASNEIDQLSMHTENLKDNFSFNRDYHLIPSGTLSEEDWSIIQYVQTTFSNAFDFPSALCSDYFDLSDRSSALISWSKFVSEVTLCVINYFRQIKQFESLNNDDRFTLTKYNLLVVVSVLKCFSYQRTDDCCSHDSSEAAEKNRQFYLLCGISISIRNTLISLIASLARLTRQDPIILSLLLNIIILSPCLSMNENEPPLKDPLAVHQAQSYYTKLLWNYLVHKWGADQPQSFFIELMSIILRLQITMKHFRDAFRDQYQSLNSLDQVAPLMQTIRQRIFLDLPPNPFKHGLHQVRRWKYRANRTADRHISVPSWNEKKEFDEILVLPSS